jgi:membrane protease YdiL (CAAX protease family)
MRTTAPAAAPRIERRRIDLLVGAIPVAIGICGLLVRLQITSLPPTAEIVALVALYGAILAGSLLAPAVGRSGPAPIGRAVALAVGLAAVSLAAIASGRPPSVPFSTWAVPLSLLAAVAEEALFRRAAYGWLARNGVAIAVVGSALLFAAVHLPFSGVAALPVDFGAGLLLSWQRWATGTWTVPAATHAAANLVAVMIR